MLPVANLKSEKLIPVNKNGHRIDTFIPQPSNDDWTAYYRRVKQQKLCNQYHLGGECGNMSCPFDHSDVDDTSLAVMQHIMRQYVCPRGSDCRLIKCYHGHLCQKGGCKGGKPCRFDQHAHTLDLHVADWATPIDIDDDDSNASGVTIG